MLKGAMLGFGEEAAQVYAPAMAEMAGTMEIQAVSGLSPEQLEAASKKFPRARLYPGHEELLAAEKELDFALAPLPAAERRRALLLALEAGLHAATHPPFCSSVTELTDLALAAERMKKVLFSAQPWERSAPWQAFSRVISEGLLGEIRRVEVRLLTGRDAGKSAQEGVTAALGWQAFSLLLGTVRRPPLFMAARLGSAAGYDAQAPEEEASFQVHFTGATGAVYLAAGAHAGRFAVTAVGRKGMAALEDKKLTIDLGQEPRVLDSKEDLAEGLSRPRWMARELETFAAEIQKPVPGGAGLKNSLYCVRLLRNAYYSASVNSAAVPV